MERVTRLTKLVDVVGGDSFNLDLADGNLAAGIEKSGFLYLQTLKPIPAKRAGHNRRAGEYHLLEIFHAEMVKVLVADQNDVRFVACGHFERIGVDGSRSLDFEGVMSDASKIQIQKFHHAPPIRLLIAPLMRSGAPELE